MTPATAASPRPDRVPRGAQSKLRAWQTAALDAYRVHDPRDFLTVATPGAGKTTYALRLAADLLDRRVVERLVVVAPTEHLKTQWAEAAAAIGISLDPEFSGARGVTSSDHLGIAVTYAGVAANSLLYRRRVEDRKTLVILDEVHHAGDSMSWGESVREAFEPATRRLALTGTPFRSDINPIPFVSYVPGPDGIGRSAADHVYGYADALRDHVVRPVMFLAYSGRMRWRTRAGDEISAVLGDDQAKDVTQQAWRTALDPQGEWIPQVLRAANRRLTEVRKHVPDAGGLVIASDQTKARAYARQLEAITGRKPTVVLSDDPRASSKISAFSASNDRWMVAVRMVSEGVDVPRLMVGVYATSTSTPLFFAQAVGRFVRARRRGETASIFLPSVPLLLRLAGELEEERDHVLGRVSTGDWTEEDVLVAQALQERDTADFLVEDQLSFEALESEATFDRILFDGGEFGTAPATIEEEEFLGIPGLLDADQVSDLLRSRGTGTTPKAAAVVVTVDVPALKRELNDCVKAYARQSGTSQAQVHSELRRASGGPEVARASAAELRTRIERIRAWAVGRR
jgi:superfamily II DNA or RNA helicase